MVLETPLALTTLCVTFGARLHSVLLSLLGRPSADWIAKVAQGLRNGPAWGPFGRPTSPKDALRTSLRHARAYIQTSGRISLRRRERHAHEVA